MPKKLPTTIVSGELPAEDDAEDGCMTSSGQTTVSQLDPLLTNP